MGLIIAVRYAIVYFFKRNVEKFSNYYRKMSIFNMYSVFIEFSDNLNAIVVVSIMGFIIPASAIPGRVALLVTQFLTLINLFIYQMVSYPSIKHVLLLQILKHLV